MTNAQAQIPIFRACSWKKNLGVGLAISKNIDGDMKVGERVGNEWWEYRDMVTW